MELKGDVKESLKGVNVILGMKQLNKILRQVLNKNKLYFKL